jgi:hypothetical protein
MTSDRSTLASAERLAGRALTNEEIAAGLRDVGGKLAAKGLLVVALNDPALTQSQHDRAVRLMREIYPERGGK